MSAVARARWVENRPTRGAPSLSLPELWRYRELIWLLALRDIQARYKQAVFGIGWAFVQPLISVAIFTFVFRGLADVPSDGQPYPLFALVGVAAWQYFSTSLNTATTSMVSNAALVTKVYFPRIAAPIAAMVPGLLALTLSLLVVAAMMGWYGVAPHMGLLALPLCILGIMAVSFGTGLLLATLNVKYRDVNHVLGFLVQLWLFASPVAYPSSLVPSQWRWLYAVNPMTGIIDTFRWAVIAGPPPSWYLLVSAASGTVLLTAGLWYFQRTERQFADVI